MHIAAQTVRAAAGRRNSPLGLRLLDWLVALDAGYRSARKLAAASEERLDDMGIARDEAKAEFTGRFGALDSAPQGSRW